MPAPAPARHLPHATLLALLASLPGCSNDNPGATDCGTGKAHGGASCGGLYPNWCGDKAMQSQETCDEGGNTPTCDADCTPVECGDGFHNSPAGEACDDGPANSDAYDDTPDQLACNTTCTGTAPHCGDGICQDPLEDATCTDCTCGDGITSAPKTCDHGMTGEPTNTPTCDADCTAVECGDGPTTPPPASGATTATRSTPTNAAITAPPAATATFIPARSATTATTSTTTPAATIA